MPWKTARDNVAIGLEIAGVARAEALRARAGLAQARRAGAFGDRYPHQLSGGQRKRVGLAQVLIRDPKILLMDEPFGPLDAQTRQIMGNLLLDLWAGDRKAVLFVTHDLEEAIALADRVVIMSAGPGARIIGDHAIDLPRPRDASEVRLLPRFHELHKAIWGQLRSRGAEGLREESAHEAGRVQLLVLQALVAVVAIGVWHVGSSVPIAGTYLLPKFFFSTPLDVARCGCGHCSPTAPPRSRPAARRSISRACSASRRPASARRSGSTC